KTQAERDRFRKRQLFELAGCFRQRCTAEKRILPLCRQRTWIRRTGRRIDRSRCGYRVAQRIELRLGEREAGAQKPYQEDQSDILHKLSLVARRLAVNSEFADE